MGSRSARVWAGRLAAGGIAGAVLFTLGWLIATPLQGPGYSTARHDLSDLAALTAHAPWVMLTAQGLAGALTIAFAFGALRPALAIDGRRGALAPWLLAGSWMGLDNVSDVFFRLNCRAADPGCSDAMRTAHLNGHVHVWVAILCGISSVILPFSLVRRFRAIDVWRRWSGPAVLVGLALAACFVAYLALEGRWGAGLAMRAIALILAAWIVALAIRVRPIAAGEAARS